MNKGISKWQSGIVIDTDNRGSQELKERLKILKYEILEDTRFAICARLGLPTSAVEKYEEAVKLTEKAKKHGVVLDFNYGNFLDYLSHNRSFFSETDGGLESNSNTRQIEVNTLEGLTRLEGKTYAELAKIQIGKIALSQYENGSVDQEIWEKVNYYNKKAGVYRLDIDDIMKKVQRGLECHPDEIKFLSYHGLDMFLQRCSILEGKSLGTAFS